MVLYEGLAWTGFWSQTAVVFCTELYELREKVRGGEHIDARRKYTTSKVMMLFVCGCYESELCVISGVLTRPSLLKKVS